MESVNEKHLNEELEKIEGLLKSCHRIKRYYNEKEIDKIIKKLEGIIEGIEMAIKFLK